MSSCPWEVRCSCFFVLQVQNFLLCSVKIFSSQYSKIIFHLWLFSSAVLKFIQHIMNCSFNNEGANSLNQERKSIFTDGTSQISVLCSLLFATLLFWVQVAKTAIFLYCSLQADLTEKLQQTTQTIKLWCSIILLVLY